MSEIVLLFVAVAFLSLLSCNALIVSRSSNLHRASSAGLSKTFHRHYIKTSSRLNSCPGDGSSISNAIDSPPILRSLYDPLPRIDCNGTVANDGNNSQIPKWVNKVTSGTLPTEEGSPHELYFEVHHRLPYNNNTRDYSTTTRQQRGLVGLVLHGGPGAACFPKHTQFFSPDLYEYVVLLDQRGCGRSTPLGEVKFNRLELLVKDVEMLRLHLIKEGLIDGWVGSKEVEEENEHLLQSTQQHNHHPWDVILGGSWGCTLGMAYAFTYPKSVRAMVLRGVCLFREKEIDWLFGNPPQSSAATAKTSVVRKTSNLRDLVVGGSSSVSMAPSSSATTTTLDDEVESQSVAAQLFPKQWKEFSSGVEHVENNKRSVLHGYYHRLLGTDGNSRYQAMRSWFRWEMGIYSNGLKKSEDNEDQNRLLVWSPSKASWVFEDAQVQNQEAVDSIRVGNPYNDHEEILRSMRSLRRFSTSPSSHVFSKIDEKILEPLPIEDTTTIATESKVETNIQPPPNGKGNTFDPNAYIPAQAMLTCYYSVNDEYCIHPYSSFLSLNPPPSIPLSSWYSSKLPPLSSSSSESCDSSISSDSPFPLPPTIAIQGGNDGICPPDTALDLHRVWRQLELRIALKSGHSMYDPVISGEIVKSLDRFGHSLMMGDESKSV
jgi:pimeloyl-ACP methyl ester carboxylesterase